MDKGFGIPCQAWNFCFFEKLANLVGSYICADENTQKGMNMDIARFMIKITSAIVLNESLRVLINKIPYVINMCEDSFGPMRIFATPKEKGTQASISDSSS